MPLPHVMIIAHAQLLYDDEVWDVTMAVWVSARIRRNREETWQQSHVIYKCCAYFIIYKYCTSFINAAYALYGTPNSKVKFFFWHNPGFWCLPTLLGKMCSVGKEWFGMYYYIGGEYILHTGMFNSFAKQSGVAVLFNTGHKKHMYSKPHEYLPQGLIQGVTSHLHPWHMNNAYCTPSEYEQPYHKHNKLYHADMPKKIFFSRRICEPHQNQSRW